MNKYYRYGERITRRQLEKDINQEVFDAEGIRGFGSDLVQRASSGEQLVLDILASEYGVDIESNHRELNK